LKSIFFCTAFLLVVAATNACAATNYYFFCDSCSTEQNYRDYGVANTPQAAGQDLVDIYNRTSHIGYHINITREYDNELHRYHTIITSSAFTTAQNAQYNATIQLFSAGKFPVEIGEYPSPGSGYMPGTESFGSSTPEAIGSVVSRTLGVLGVLRTLGAWELVKEMFGVYPTAVVLFPNGDVAMYTVVNPAGGSLSVVYQAGTSRNANGDPLDPPAHGGNYVHGGTSDGQGHFNNRVDLLPGGLSYLSCSYVLHDDGSKTLIGCYQY